MITILTCATFVVVCWFALVCVAIADGVRRELARERRRKCAR